MSVASLQIEYPQCAEDLHKILTGNIAGYTIRHIWTIDGLNHEFVGFISSFVNPFYEIYFNGDKVDSQLDKQKVGAMLCGLIS